MVSPVSRMRGGSPGRSPGKLGGVEMALETKVRGGPPRVSGRTGNAISLQAACEEAGVSLEVGRLAIRRMWVFAQPGDDGWLVSPASVEVLIELGARQGVPAVIRLGGVL
jgi:hypothetical protein